MGQSSVSKKIRDLERLIRRKGSSDELDEKMKKLVQENQNNLLKGTYSLSLAYLSHTLLPLTITLYYILIIHLQVKEKANSTKYHMVKFVERKKVTRSIQAIDSKIKNTTGKNFISIMGIC